MSTASDVARDIIEHIRDELQDHPDVSITFSKMDYQGGSLGWVVSIGIEDTLEMDGY